MSKEISIIDMFPYTSGNLHVGHSRNFYISDIYSKHLKIHKGLKVFHPMGWDSFGLPAENASLLHNIRPYTWTMENIKRMKSDSLLMGLDIHWDNEFSTSDPDYIIKNQEL